jgi:hypothetical protein
MRSLLAHSSNKSSEYQVKFDYKLGTDAIDILFEVQFFKGLHSSSAFSQTPEKNWGLWEYDVVETFLQLRNHETDDKAPYLEIQISPLNQKFFLKIIEPRKIFYTPLKLEAKLESKSEGKFWVSKLNIPFQSIGLGTELYGNFFASLGPENKKEYYAWKINPEMKADFHRPDLFRKLL